jgi:hypothetical protein
MDREEASAGGMGDAPAPGGPPQEPEIDIVLLAQKVYDLMRAELRLERARGAATLRQR